ncbi:hypothetical protein Tco_0282759 [Tanacetum coccineum]
MEEFVTKDQANYNSGITSIMVNGKAAFELKGKFLDDLRDNALSGTNGEDAKKVDNKEGITNKGFSDLEEANKNDEHKIAEIFRIETNLFDYETSLCTEFKEFNHLLKVDTELFTHNIERTKTYEDYESELNNEVAWLKRSFGDFHELDYELLVKLKECWWKINDHECSLFANWRDDIRGPYANIDTTYDPYLNEINGRACNKNDNQEKEEQHKEGRCDLFNDPAREPPVCKIRRSEMIKYSFRQEEEYVAIKQYKYDDLTRTNEDACHAYQEIFCNIDEGWLVPSCFAILTLSLCHCLYRLCHLAILCKYHKDILRRILVNACKLDDVQQEFLNGRIPKET